MQITEGGIPWRSILHPSNKFGLNLPSFCQQTDTAVLFTKRGSSCFLLRAAVARPRASVHTGQEYYIKGRRTCQLFCCFRCHTSFHVPTEPSKPHMRFSIVIFTMTSFSTFVFLWWIKTSSAAVPFLGSFLPCMLATLTLLNWTHFSRILTVNTHRVGRFTASVSRWKPPSRHGGVLSESNVQTCRSFQRNNVTQECLQRRGRHGEGKVFLRSE